MRIGIDLRVLQFSEVQRGYGQYVRSILKGLNQVSPEDELLFFRLQSRPLPSDLKELFPNSSEVGLSVAATWRESGSIWSRARMQSVPLLPGKAKWAYYRSQGQEIQAKLKEHRVNAYFVPAPMFPEQGPLLRLAVPTVYGFHDAIPYVFRDRYIDTWDVDARRLYLGQREAYKLADVLAAVSESARQDAIDHFGVAPDKVLVAKNSLDASFSEPVEAIERDRIRSKYRLRNPFFVFCSILDYHKNLGVAIEAVAKLIDLTSQNFHLAVIGGLPEDQRSTVRALAFDAGLSGKEVIMTGHVSALELRALFQSSTAVLSPSLAEGFGFPVLQGMLSNVPVVASNIAPYREIMGNAGVRLSPQEPMEWAATLQRIVEDPNYAKALTEGAAPRAKEFDTASQGRQLREALLKAINLRNRQR